MSHNVKNNIIECLLLFLKHRYFNDMYLDFNLAQETASKIKNTEQYITNHLAHDGIRHDPKDVITNLFNLSKREFD